jgi:Domain of unknown function (DUF4198)
MNLLSRAHHLATCLLLACASASAHDTWFAPQADGSLLIGTGNRFPVMELAVDDKYFVQRGCAAADGAPRTLARQRFTDTTTVLKAQPGAASCFVQLEPFDIDLPEDKIAIYFKEVRPTDEVLAAWERLRARGLPFRERYVKSARVELGPGAGSARPVGITMDVLRAEPAGALAVGSDAAFQVLRDGKPLPDFNVELINERSPLGVWLRTDAQGRVRAKLPLPGRWLLRGVDLRVATADATRFESAFLSYAFEVVR